MPVMARFGRAAGEDDCCGGGSQSESTHAQNVRGRQGCTKHKLPRPIFCLVHRFVRLNYAQPPATLSRPKRLTASGIFTEMANRIAVLANQLHAHIFRRFAGKANSNRIRLGGLSFQKVKQPLPGIPGFDDKLNDLCDAQRFLTLLCNALWLRCQGAGTSPPICQISVWERTP